MGVDKSSWPNWAYEKWTIFQGMIATLVQCEIYRDNTSKGLINKQFNISMHDGDKPIGNK